MNGTHWSFHVYLRNDYRPLVVAFVVALVALVVVLVAHIAPFFIWDWGSTEFDRTIG